jgi:hypothetical protein
MQHVDHAGSVTRFTWSLLAGYDRNFFPIPCVAQRRVRYEGTFQHMAFGLLRVLGRCQTCRSKIQSTLSVRFDSEARHNSVPLQTVQHVAVPLQPYSELQDGEAAVFRRHQIGRCCDSMPRGAQMVCASKCTARQGLRRHHTRMTGFAARRTDCCRNVRTVIKVLCARSLHASAVSAVQVVDAHCSDALCADARTRWGSCVKRASTASLPLRGRI